jgi:LacI family transcriptional regulator
MKELGYSPNLNAQRLVSGRSYTVALDWQGDPHRSVLQDVYLARLIEGVQTALLQHDYALLLCGPRETGALTKWLMGRTVDGAVVVGGYGGASDREAAQHIVDCSAPCAVITHEPVTDLPGVASVVLNLAEGVRQVAQAFALRQHSRIAYIGSLAGDTVLGSFRFALAKYDLNLPDERVVIAGIEVEDGARAMETLLRLPERPTAVFARTDVLAMGAYRTILRHGLSIPRDISLVGHDDLNFAAWLEPALTTVQIPYERMGGLATESLLTLMNHPDRANVVETVSTVLQLRGTLGPAPVS